ncbi:MAG: hypothetical protein O3A02_01395, partial [bacterium]|nr:hypothetical protein [bacterium]
MPDAGERRFVISAEQIRTMLLFGTLGMIAVPLALLLLSTARPQGAFVPVDDSQHQALLQTAQAKLTGFEVRADGGARIDI